MTFRNYWGVFSDMSFNQKGIDDRLTRGGPLTLSTADKNFFLGLNSDGRKRVNLNVNQGYGYNERGNWYSNTNLNHRFEAVNLYQPQCGTEFQSQLSVRSICPDRR